MCARLFGYGGLSNTLRPLPTPQITPYLILLLLSLLLRCDPSDINISDEMSKTTVWKSLNSNQKDTRPVAAKKARPYPLFPHPCHLGNIPATHCGHSLLLCFATVALTGICKLRAAKLQLVLY